MKTPIGIDLGKSSIKHVTATDQGEQPSWLATGRVTSVIGGNGTGAIRYKGQDLITGREAILGTGFSWSSTEDKDDRKNLIFALSVLARLGIAEAEAVVGLPVSQANSAIVNRLKALLSGKHEIAVHDEPKTIDISVSVLAEPLGTYYSLILTPDGRVIGGSPYLSQFIGIVDIGFRTVDIVALDGGQLATTKDSTLSGITVLFDQVAKILEADYGKLRANEIAKLHTWLIGGCQEPLTIAGKYVRQDFTAEVARLKAELSSRIMDEVNSVLSVVRPDKLIFTGGGAAFLRAELLRIKPEITFHPRPKFANAEGFFKAAAGRINNAR